MSYILDALKKAERERGSMRVPTPMTVHDYRGMQRNRLPVVAAGLLVCAAAIWFLLPALRTVGRPPSSPGAGSVNVPPSPPPQAEPPASPKPEIDSGILRDAAAPVVPQVGIAAAPHDSAARKPVERERSAGQSTPGVPRRSAREPVSPPAVEKAPPQPAARIDSPATKEVIPAPRAAGQPKQTPLQEAVGKMTVSLLMYAETEADRSVWINGRKYVKGNYVDGLYLIESITAEGVVLSYEGERALLRP